MAGDDHLDISGFLTCLPDVDQDQFPQKKSESFTLFPLLPTEIRLKIWRMASRKDKPRRITFSCCWKSCRCTQEPHRSFVPPTLSINRESREETLKVYRHLHVKDLPAEQQQLLDMKQTASIWLNVFEGGEKFYISLETAWGWDAIMDWLESMEGLHGECLFDKVEELLISHVTWASSDMLIHTLKRHDHRFMLDHFRCLKKVYVTEDTEQTLIRWGVGSKLATKERREECKALFQQWFEGMKQYVPEMSQPKIVAGPWRRTDKSIWEGAMERDIAAMDEAGDAEQDGAEQDAIGGDADNGAGSSASSGTTSDGGDN